MALLTAPRHWGHLILEMMINSRAEFKVDRPFLFMIYEHQTKIPIFVGRIVDPEGKQKLRDTESFFS